MQIEFLSQLIRSYGLKWVLLRAFYECQLRSGWHAFRFRQRPWRDNELAHWLKPDVPPSSQAFYEEWQHHRPHFFFAPQQRTQSRQTLHNIWGERKAAHVIQEAEVIQKGIFPYFSRQNAHLGFPPEWHVNPFTGGHAPLNVHWSHIAMYSPIYGDLKYIWEPGRFAFSYLLARAYWISGKEEFAEIFWQILDSWREANPPNRGAHWKCGQEISLRIMAWAFALYAFAEASVTSAERVAWLVGMIAAQAARVEADHLYAHLQQNNHALSEGVGLWTVGLLFPQLKAASRWRETGRKILESEGMFQIQADGSYIQHSTNYHRVMLHLFAWAIRLGKLHGYGFSQKLLDRVRQAGEFLYQLQDQETGGVPNYGANDGAFILPLNSCDYRDFRPVLNSIHYLFTRTRLYEKGLWDEDLFWMFGVEALKQPIKQVPRKSWGTEIGGYYTLRGDASWGMIRCATFENRPSQADMLHLDIWRKGINIACDPGSYLYNASPPWNNALVTTAVHNTLMVDRQDQMTRGPRFLWFPWLTSTVRHFSVSSTQALTYFEGEHDGYARLEAPVIHRRAVLMSAADIWIVFDDLLGMGEHEFTLHWLLADLPYQIEPQSRHVLLQIGTERYGVLVGVCDPESPPIHINLLRGAEERAPRGWHAPYYGVRFPALSLRLTTKAAVPCRVFSIFVPADLMRRLSVSATHLHILDDAIELMLILHPPGLQSIMTQASFKTRDFQEHLTI
ncbi:hypothetical cytosolic protein [Candidatus Vecturithrix granuli]|uniref:Hypothetical cytosolic protein n=1 Tax=Vecturithrix granuli TaxID=1499967 RepID=A0A081BXU1_VECG1|nr:hypothetical cytosolic protein [Candidatus Vecturithrix granuli]